MAVATPKFDELVRRARANGFARVVVRQRNGADRKFYGALVGEVGRDKPGRCSESPFDLDEDRWTCLRLYVLRSGRFAVVKEEVDIARLRLRCESEVLDDVDAVVKCLGQSEFAKALYAVLGIDAAQDLDAATDEERGPSPTAEEPVKAATAREAMGIKDADSRPGVTLCDETELDRRLQKLRLGRENERMRLVLEAIKERGLMRPLAQARPELMNTLATLGARFPNLAEVVEFVCRQVKLCLRTRRQVLRLPPALLVGAPGTGKTRLLKELARILGVDFAMIDCGVLTANFVLAGNDPAWSNGKAGAIFETLAEGATLNPLILLDEIDKLGGERRYDPYGPLHGLLERHSARRFTDEYMKIAVDASRVLWFATANKTDAIPTSILSRLKRFDVRPPSAAEMAAVVRSVYADLAGDEELAGVFAPELPSETVAALSTMTPREVGEALFDAMTRASWDDAAGEDGRLIVLPSHVRAATTRRTERRVIGFTADRKSLPKAA